jgi:PAS domain S-box-containing protein
MTNVKPRILAIDDNPANLLTLAAALEADFDLQFATSGEAGLALASQMAPDLILLDVMMPEMNGYETCRRLKAEPRLRSIPVIFVTALGDSAAESAGLALGAADYMTKPINVEIARQRIRNLLERENLRKEVEAQRDHLEELVQARTLDLSIARQVEVELRKLSRTVEQSPASIVITDRTGSIEYVNPGFEELTGYARGEVLGGNPRILRSGLTSAQTYSQLWKTISAGGTWRGELCNRRKNGELFWEAASISGLKDETGQVTHYIAVKENITERKAALDELWQARRREIEIGSTIQRTLLQGNVPGGIEGAWLATHADPSQIIDGDFYTIRRYRPACFELLVGDVMGKGVPAALIGAGILTSYSNLVSDLLVAGSDAQTLPTPAQIVNAMHRVLTPELIKVNTFATLALYRFDLDAGTLTYVNAGHTPGLLTRESDPRPVAILGDNLPIGVIPEEEYVQSSIAVGPGDRLLIYSDGITESLDEADEEFGLERLSGLFEAGSRADLPPATLLQSLRGELRRYNGGRPLTDDQTALVVALHERRVQPRGQIADRVKPFVFDLPWCLDELASLPARIGERAGHLPAEDADALILASFEAATNIIRHARLLIGDATITCRITREDEALAVELFYPSEAFSPPANLQPDFSGVSEGGFGLYTIEQSVDSVEYGNPMPGISSVRMVKRASAVAA